jgi:hypothetical protein
LSIQLAKGPSREKAGQAGPPESNASRIRIWPLAFLGRFIESIISDSLLLATLI